MPSDRTAYGCDPQGMPLDPAHPWNRQTGNVVPLDPYVRRLRDLERIFKGGVTLAAVEAVLVCQERRIAWPAWLQAAGAEIVLDMLVGTSKALGRTGNSIARYREDFKHFTRWDMVEDIRNHQQMPQHTDTLGTTWSDAYAAASKELRGTSAQGSPDAIEYSHRLVKAENERGGLRFPYLDRVVRRLKLDKR